AEDGIRDFHVTGVQTCALPIFNILPQPKPEQLVVVKKEISIEHVVEVKEVIRIEEVIKEREVFVPDALLKSWSDERNPMFLLRRSEERRVGKECRSRRAR